MFTNRHYHAYRSRTVPKSQSNGAITWIDAVLKYRFCKSTIFPKKLDAHSRIKPFLASNSARDTNFIYALSIPRSQYCASGLVWCIEWVSDHSRHWEHDIAILRLWEHIQFCQKRIITDWMRLSHAYGCLNNLSLWMDKTVWSSSQKWWWIRINGGVN